jgi:hypothetical protein
LTGTELEVAAITQNSGSCQAVEAAPFSYFTYNFAKRFETS